jgi:hypothetical protein
LRASKDAETRTCDPSFEARAKARAPQDDDYLFAGTTLRLYRHFPRNFRNRLNLLFSVLLNLLATNPA